jgi:hypothetical protein
VRSESINDHITLSQVWLGRLREPCHNLAKGTSTLRGESGNELTHATRRGRCRTCRRAGEDKRNRGGCHNRKKPSFTHSHSFSFVRSPALSRRREYPRSAPQQAQAVAFLDSIDLLGSRRRPLARRGGRVYRFLLFTEDGEPAEDKEWLNAV